VGHDKAMHLRLDTNMDAPEEIKSRLDIAELIGEYLPLKPAGSGAFKTLCPFHQEKTPSFYVSRTRQTWHCFGCDEGGDVFTFVEKLEGMEFREALEFLAQKVGVTLPKFDGQKASYKKRVYEVNDLAMRFFRSALASLPQAEHARVYLKKRGVDDLTADLFGLGYAPNGWDSLTNALLKKNITSEEMLQAGLVGKREQGTGVYDRFRDRLMFPIADVHGNIVGFTGRILNDQNKEAKYVNTPETQAYRKSAVLYGLDKAKGAIRNTDLAVIVEGNMDVVASHQFEVLPVVASSGTALTAEQLTLLKRFTKNLAIAFDQDNAGKAATLRGLDLARGQDFNIKIISLPPELGKDPDDVIRKDPALWKKAIENAESIMDWIYKNAFRDRHAHQPEDKKLIAKDVLEEAQRIADPIERDHWMKKLATDLNTSEHAIREAFDRIVSSKKPGASRNVNRQPRVSSPDSGSPAENEANAFQAKLGTDMRMERRVLASIIARDGLFLPSFEEFGLESSNFRSKELEMLYEILKKAYNSGEFSNQALGAGHTIRPPVHLQPEEAKTFDAIAFIAEREFAGMTVGEIKSEQKQGIEQLKSRHSKRLRTSIEEEMREAERLGDEEKICKLLKRFEELT